MAGAGPCSPCCLAGHLGSRVTAEAQSARRDPYSLCVDTLAAWCEAELGAPARRTAEVAEAAEGAPARQPSVHVTVDEHVLSPKNAFIVAITPTAAQSPAQSHGESHDKSVSHGSRRRATIEMEKVPTPERVLEGRSEVPPSAVDSILREWIARAQLEKRSGTKMDAAERDFGPRPYLFGALRTHAGTLQVTVQLKLTLTLTLTLTLRTRARCR